MVLAEQCGSGMMGQLAELRIDGAPLAPKKGQNCDQTADRQLSVSSTVHSRDSFNGVIACIKLHLMSIIEPFRLKLKRKIKQMPLTWPRKWRNIYFVCEDCGRFRVFAVKAENAEWQLRRVSKGYGSSIGHIRCNPIQGERRI